MRINVYWRGRDVIDVELHVWEKRDDGPVDEGPTLQATGGGIAELSGQDSRPDTSVRIGFGSRACR